PFWVGSLMGFGFGLLQTLTFGLVHNSVLTKDQVKLLRVDNVVSEDAKGFAELGIHPLAPEAIIADYLWRFRPSGQYDAIKDSARNLKV
ncbi:MAG: complex I NDUFA9 subunit family protein, partial [Shimia sp.]|nr:complex I NDUFA9 subunit family protein [Shimia sp.]